MTVTEVAGLSGYCRQRINRLVDIVPFRYSGIRRTSNGRLEVVNEEVTRRWCEFLRGRKAYRRENNRLRQEKRERLKIRRAMLCLDLSPLMREVRAQTASRLAEIFKAKFVHEGFADHLWQDAAEEVGRHSVKKVMRPMEFACILFAMKGRKIATKAARDTLFEWLTGQIPVDCYTGYADIARDYGCTRAALSVAAKQLPTAVLRRTGRRRR